MEPKRYTVFAVNDRTKEADIKEVNFFGVAKIISLTPDILVIEDENGNHHTYNGPFNVELRTETFKISINEQ